MASSDRLHRDPSTRTLNISRGLKGLRPARGVGGPQALPEGPKGFLEDAPVRRLPKDHQGILAFVQSLGGHLLEEQFPLAYLLKPPLLLGFGAASPGRLPGWFGVLPLMGLLQPQESGCLEGSNKELWFYMQVNPLDISYNSRGDST